MGAPTPLHVEGGRDQTACGLYVRGRPPSARGAGRRSQGQGWAWWKVQVHNIGQGTGLGFPVGCRVSRRRPRGRWHPALGPKRGATCYPTCALPGASEGRGRFARIACRPARVGSQAASPQRLNCAMIWHALAPGGPQGGAAHEGTWLACARVPRGARGGGVVDPAQQRVHHQARGLRGPPAREWEGEQRRVGMVTEGAQRPQPSGGRVRHA